MIVIRSFQGNIYGRNVVIEIDLDNFSIVSAGQLRAWCKGQYFRDLDGYIGVTSKFAACLDA